MNPRVRFVPVRLALRALVVVLAASGCELLAPLDPWTTEQPGDGDATHDGSDARDAASDGSVTPEADASYDTSTKNDSPSLADTSEGATPEADTLGDTSTKNDGPSLTDASDGATHDATMADDGDVSVAPSPLDAGDGGAPDSNDSPFDAGDAGLVESSLPTIGVRGTVIGYWRHRVPDVDVYLGDRTTKTDVNGQFTFSNVTPPYDIGLAVRGPNLAAWVFKGLTRTDPTLQVRDAFEDPTTTTKFQYANLPPRSSDDAGPVPRTLRIAFGSPDTSFETFGYEPLSEDTFNFAFWEGPSATAGTVHALLWESPADGLPNPLRYVSYDAKPLALAFNTPVTVGLDMSADTIATGQVTGSIDSFASDRRLDGYIRFDSGAIMHVVSIENNPTTFAMLMPKIPNATISVSALSGTISSGPYAVAHRDGILPDAPGVQLTVPQPVSLAAPAAGQSGVTTSTTFQWSASPRVALLVVTCDGLTGTDPLTLFYVVTEDYRAVLPSLTGPSGIPLPTNRYCLWEVQVHGSYPTVNDATGPDGMLDPYTFYNEGEFQGPKRDNGSFTTSESWGLTTAP